MGTAKRMRIERTDVTFPMWRKKVDYSLFGHSGSAGTVIPMWLWQSWDVERLFAKSESKNDPAGSVEVHFEGECYGGSITKADKSDRANPVYRLWFSGDLAMHLRQRFLMSYMRSLERALCNEDNVDVEEEIPFWEFLDIEFDATTRRFHLRAHYVQKCMFPRLFARLVGTQAVDEIHP